MWLYSSFIVARLVLISGTLIGVQLDCVLFDMDLLPLEMKASQVNGKALIETSALNVSCRMLPILFLGNTEGVSDPEQYVSL